MENNLLTKKGITNETLLLSHYYGKEDSNLFINRGDVQLDYFYCKLKMLEEPSIVLIDLPERNLDFASQKDFLNFILSFKNISKLIVTTHAPSIIRNYLNYVIDV